MKLPDIKSCLREFVEGNIKTQTALGETTVDRSMDRGSIPLISTIPDHYLILQEIVLIFC